jgi:hypothetical protein
MSSVENPLCDCLQRCETQIRNAPFAAVAIASLIGFLVRPATLIRLAVAAIRPGLLIFAIVKILGLRRSQPARE